MEPKQTQITLTETDDGFRIEVTGKSLKEAMSCCSMPLFAGGMAMKAACCTPETDSKTDCCSPEAKKT